MIPRAKLAPLETRQTRITEFFKISAKNVSNKPLRMQGAPKKYTVQKIPYYYRALS
jgi:hypothetical protein